MKTFIATHWLPTAVWALGLVMGLNALPLIVFSLRHVQFLRSIIVASIVIAIGMVIYDPKLFLLGLLSSILFSVLRFAYGSPACQKFFAKIVYNLRAGWEPYVPYLPILTPAH